MSHQAMDVSEIANQINRRLQGLITRLGCGDSTRLEINSLDGSFEGEVEVSVNPSDDGPAPMTIHIQDEQMIYLGLPSDGVVEFFAADEEDIDYNLDQIIEVVGLIMTGGLRIETRGNLLRTQREFITISGGVPKSLTRSLRLGRGMSTSPEQYEPYVCSQV
jgi:hypothetical protein